ncbi:MAG: SCP2 sterol-binding domain-containing protein [Clostridiales bacterium]|jgi:predicted lipid carrier protein YhbT|nr:SCP2 sterol-binding domain-containing protein [Clostridiales bacterium]
MASEINQDVQLIVEKVYSKFSSADLSQFPEKLAIQVNLTGKISGVFYIEVLNGVLSVKPYEYIDKDAAISITKTNLFKILDSKLKFDTAYKTEKLTIEGDLDKAFMLKKFL